MDVHIPKRAHRWQELASEVGIIVVGVLIALAAQQIFKSGGYGREICQPLLAG